MRVLRALGILMIMLCMTVAPAYALLLGNDLSIDWYFPDLTTSVASTTATVVDPGIEWNPGMGVDVVDVSDEFITIHNNCMGWRASSGFNGFVFTDIGGTIDAFSSFELVSITADILPQFDPILSFMADSLSINFNASSTVDNGLSVGQTYVFHVGGDTQPVPEPATMLLFGTGLIGLAGFKKKFKK